MSGLKLGSVLKLVVARVRDALRWNDGCLDHPKLPELLETLENARREWHFAKVYFNSVSDPDLVDHAIFYLGATEKKYIYLLKQAREHGVNTERYGLS